MSGDPVGIEVIEVVMPLAPNDAALPKVRSLAEKRFGMREFGLDEAGLIVTTPAVIDRLGKQTERGLVRSCCSPTTAAPTSPSNCLPQR